MENKITKIQVFGSDCPACKELFENVKKVAIKLNIETKVVHITDPIKVLELGLITLPVLVVNDKLVLAGRGRSEEEIEEALISSSSQEKGCGGGCHHCCHC